MTELEQHSNTELVTLLQMDNVKAFDQLYWTYYGPVYRNSLKLVKDREEAENIVQEVFLTLWEKRSCLDPEKPLSNWLFVVSYNKSITHIKKTLKQALMFKQVENEILLPEEPEFFLKEARLKILDEAFMSLSPQKRKVFDLCKLQGKSYEESARELNISRHTVKEYLSHAVKTIKEYAEQHPHGHIEVVYIMVVFKMIFK